MMNSDFPTFRLLFFCVALEGALGSACVSDRGSEATIGLSGEENTSQTGGGMAEESGPADGGQTSAPGNTSQADGTSTSGETAEPVDTSSSDGDSSHDIPEPGEGAEGLVGYWIYSRLVENDRSVWERSDVDLQFTPGEGYGLHKFAFSASGRAFYIYNTRTLSDFAHPGTFEVRDNLLFYHEIMKYSCAHPHPLDEGSNALNPRTTYSHFYTVGNDELWLQLDLWTGFNNTPFPKAMPNFAPSTTEGKWMVLERLSEAEFYGQFMVRVCQGSPSCPCHPDCSSQDLLQEPSPLPVCDDTWPYS